MIRDVWDQQRRRLRRDMAEAMVIQAKAGKPNAARYVANFLQSEQSPAGFDHQHVPISVMVEITGKTRQTLHLWTRKHGCPRNADATYNLTEFFPWYGRWQQNKVPAGHLVFQVRKTIRETLRELVRASSDACNTVTETETTAPE